MQEKLAAIDKDIEYFEATDARESEKVAAGEKRLAEIQQELDTQRTINAALAEEHFNTQERLRDLATERKGLKHEESMALDTVKSMQPPNDDEDTPPAKKQKKVCIFRTDDDMHICAHDWCKNPVDAEARYGHISKWNTSKVTNMVHLFYDCKEFNEDISGWDTSNVTYMNGIFDGADAFNQDLSGWDLRKVTEAGRAKYFE